LNGKHLPALTRLWSSINLRPNRAETPLTLCKWLELQRALTRVFVVSHTYGVRLTFISLFIAFRVSHSLEHRFFQKPERESLSRPGNALHRGWLRFSSFKSLCGRFCWHMRHSRVERRVLYRRHAKTASQKCQKSCKSTSCGRMITMKFMMTFVDSVDHDENCALCRRSGVCGV
jgi:hypothetical protein